MRNKLAALITAGLIAFLALPASAAAAVECEFILGFATLKALIDAAEGPDKVGDCLENQRFNPENGDALQQTTGGLLVWRKADNWTAFTDGYRTWINGPYGLQSRFNTEQFDWEAPATPPATPVPTVEIGAEYTARCSNGIAVPNPQANSGLVTDCATLLQARDTLTGGGDLLNWHAGRAITDWKGITIGGSPRRVTELQYSVNPKVDDRWRLTGTIPPELGALTQLQHLNLDFNHLTGPIPPELGALTNLESLRLIYNQLTGPIPPQLGALTNLQWLRLSRNRLTGPIPPQLGSLTNLQRLWLDHNQLTGPIPPQLGSLTNLETVFLEDTGLCVPNNSTFRAWVQPIRLFRGQWCPSTLAPTSAPGAVTPTPSPASMPEPSLASDRDVLVALYHATGGPNWGTNTYWLSDAPIHLWYGVQTDENGRVTRLELDHGGGRFGNNLVGALPAELGHLTHLEELLLSNNNLTGPLPAALGNLTRLKVLVLFNNDLKGPLPAELGNLTNLEVLDLDRNSNLSGPLPQSLARLTRLRKFRFYSTRLCPPANSTFRTWLRSVPNSTDSVWYGCHISQQSAATDRAALVALYNATGGKNWRINKNWLSDEPIGLWYGVGTDRNGHVTRLKLRSNNLAGPLPAELGNLTKLEELLLSNNNLTGPLPVELGNLTRLKHLYLTNVNLTGSLPAGLGNLANLTVLSFDGNHLTGPLPAAWGNLTKLDLLFLEENDLTRPIPAEWGNMTRLRRLGLSGNNLSGPLPHSLTGLAMLRYLYLDGTGLCVPADSAFEAWTRGIDQFYGQWGCPAN